MTGIVKRIVLDKGYGFIRAEDNKEYFFHYSALIGVTLNDLTEGFTKVEFRPNVGKNGKPRAENVEVIGNN
jgi:cold shock CspA family protein